MAIAVMACRKMTSRCSGTGCFKAYNSSTDAFEVYGDNREDLSSFFYCSGCSDTMTKDENWSHKIAQLKKNNVKTIHISRCINVNCDNYDRHEKILKKEGFEVVHGTHK
ncbi:CGGC domain-containing protein [Clostridium sardiniense]|uniref:CGGC domain-containing protein n=1 Tax=Clostridium sardiniense TaxID=29369 RepID=UPI003D344361